jgi:transposase
MENKDAIIFELRALIEDLRREIILLKKENTDLKEQLRLNSQNSSKPPSSDRYPKKEPKPPSKERPKRQGFARKWFAKEEVSEFKYYFPETCDGCGANSFLPKKSIAEARQTIEIPPIKPLVKEHQAMSCRCAKCGKKVRAFLPFSVTTSVFGPKIKALSVTLAGQFHLSKRNIKELFKTLFSIDISLGSVIKTHEQAALLLKDPYEKALAILRQSQTVYTDETGWKTKKQKRWLWQASDQSLVMFKIFPSRSKKAFQAFLGKDCIQNLVTDRFRVYATDGLHQFCWAHLKRDFKRVEEREGLVSIIDFFRNCLY